MKFFKWLGKSRENEVPEVFGASIKVILLGEHGGGGTYNGPYGASGTGGSFSLTPSPTTFYPPIEEKD